MIEETFKPGGKVLGGSDSLATRTVRRVTSRKITALIINNVSRHASLE